ncbi:unnamed protein product [Acanthoscelides obtectus]
MPHL